MQDSYTIGFAGFGYMGTRLLRGLLTCWRERESPPEIVGFRLRKPTLERIRRLCPDIIKADGYEEIFEGRTVRDLILASPTEQHIPQAEFAIEHGADVFLEKPISTDLDAARAFVEYVLARESIVFIDYIEDALPISIVRDEILFGALRSTYGLRPKSFLAVRTKDRENPCMEKNWRDFDSIAGRDSIHCLFKILKILSRTTGGREERNILPLYVRADSKDLTHPDPDFRKQISGQIVGEMRFSEEVTVHVYTSALAVARRGFEIPSCFGVPESESEEVKLQHISCSDPAGQEVALSLDFIGHTFDVAGLDTGPLDAYLRTAGFEPSKTNVEVDGQSYRRYAFGTTDIDTWVMRYYFGLKRLKGERPVQEINRDISLCTVVAGYYTQLWSELLQRSSDEGSAVLQPEYVRSGALYILEI